MSITRINSVNAVGLVGRHDSAHRNVSFGSEMPQTVSAAGRQDRAINGHSSMKQRQLYLDTRCIIDTRRPARSAEDGRVWPAEEDHDALAAAAG
jgi:hypothetical protein